MYNIEDFETFLNISESIEDKTKVNIVLVTEQGMLDYYNESTKAFLNRSDAEKHYIDIINKYFDQEFLDYESSNTYFLEKQKDSGYNIELLSIPFIS